jgi:hypothetical protein
MYKLEEAHVEKAKQIIAANRTRKRCNECYDRGWLGMNSDGLVVPCARCTDIDKAMADWKDYVAGVPELKEHFHDLFEEPQEEESAPAEK